MATRRECVRLALLGAGTVLTAGCSMQNGKLTVERVDSPPDAEVANASDLADDSLILETIGRAAEASDGRATESLGIQETGSVIRTLDEFPEQDGSVYFSYDGATYRVSVGSGG